MSDRDEIERRKRLLKNLEMSTDVFVIYAFPFAISMVFLGFFLLMAASAYRIAVDPVKTDHREQSVGDR